MTAHVNAAIDGHVFVKVDDYLTVSQARLLARQIMAAAEDAEIREAQNVDVQFTKMLGEQLTGPWFDGPDPEFMPSW